MRTTTLILILALAACGSPTPAEAYKSLHHDLEKAGYIRTDFGRPEKWTLYSEKDASGRGVTGTEDVVVSVDVTTGKINGFSWRFMKGNVARVNCPGSYGSPSDLPAKPDPAALDVAPDAESGTEIDRKVGDTTCVVTVR